jgi:hypothetical protein
MKKLMIPICVSALFSACGTDKKEKKEGPENLIGLELVDSLIVEELSTLAMDDYSPKNGYYLIKGTKTRNLYLVDEKGLILKEYDILNEGPDGVGTNGALGYRFLDKNRWVAQGIYNGYHIYDPEGKKVLKVPHNNVGFFGMSIYTFRTTFNPYVKDGVPYIVGEELNSFNPAEMNADK